MSINKNRNCGCQEDNEMMCCNQMQDVERTVDCDERREMAEQIRCYEFAITELALYLDTHPDDTRALALHKEYCKCYKEAVERYQKKYGPLSIFYPCNKWRWLEQPWPWEGGNF